MARATWADRVSKRERTRLLNVLDRLRAVPPSRTALEVDAELKDLRAARRAGGRRHRA